MRPVSVRQLRKITPTVLERSPPSVFSKSFTLAVYGPADTCICARHTVGIATLFFVSCERKRLTPASGMLTFADHCTSAAAPVSKYTESVPLMSAPLLSVALFMIAALADMADT